MTEPLKPGELIKAVRFSSIEKVKDLLARGAAIDEKDGFGNTALIWAADAGDMQMVRLLLDKGASPGAINKSGYIAPDVAEARGHSEVARILREALKIRRRVDAGHAAASKKQIYMKNQKKLAQRSGPV